MGSKIIEIFNKIAYNVLSALYQPFWAAVLLAFLTMFLYLYGKEHGWKKNNFIRNMFATWWRTFKNSSTFRRIFLLAFYTAMILLRTVLNREIWFDPLGKIFGGWGLYEEGQFTTESIENFMLFVPFSVLLLWAFQKELLDESENIRYIYSKFICKKFYFAERARRGNSGRKLIESYGVANTILYDHGGTTLDK